MSKLKNRIIKEKNTKKNNLQFEFFELIVAFAFLILIAEYLPVRELCIRINSTSSLILMFEDSLFPFPEPSTRSLMWKKTFFKSLLLLIEYSMKPH